MNITINVMFVGMTAIKRAKTKTVHTIETNIVSVFFTIRHQSNLTYHEETNGIIILLDIVAICIRDSE